MAFGAVTCGPLQQVASGLAAYGHRELTAVISDETRANAMTNGISERYDSLSGKKLGVEYLGMTCTIITMTLDGLCSHHRLKLRDNRSHARAPTPRCQPRLWAQKGGAPCNSPAVPGGTDIV